MNTITRTLTNLTVATGMAAAVLTLGATGAQAETPPAPKPGPVLAQPTPGPSDPIGPFDASPATPKPPKPPKGGPKDLGSVTPPPVVDPKPQPGDQGCFEGCDLPDLPLSDAVPTAEPTDPAATDSSNAVAGSGANSGANSGAIEGVDDAAPTPASVRSSQDGGSEAFWLIAGVVMVGTAGTVLVAARRRKARQA